MNYKDYWKTDKELNKWAKVMRKKLEGRYLDLFNEQMPTMSKANNFIRGSFVVFWEIKTDDSLAEHATYITQATLLTLADNFITFNKMQEANAAHQMMINFTRLLAHLQEENEGLDEA